MEVILPSLSFDTCLKIKALLHANLEAKFMTSYPEKSSGNLGTFLS